MNKTDNHDEGSVLSKTIFEGRISAGNFELPLSFAAHAGDDCRLIFDLLTVSGKAYVALSKFMGEPGRPTMSMRLSGKSSDGRVFSSDHMEISGLSTSSDGLQIRLKTGEASISVPRPQGAKRLDVGLKLGLRGFKSFRPSPVRSRLGDVLVQGGHKNIQSDDVSGAIIIISDDAWVAG